MLNICVFRKSFWLFISIKWFKVKVHCICIYVWRERERENIGCFTVTIVDETVTNFAVIYTVVNTGSEN